MLEMLNDQLYQAAQMRQQEMHQAARQAQLLHSLAAGEQFRLALRRGRLRSLWARLNRRSTELPALAPTRPMVANQYYAGVQTAPIRQIRGSEGRSHDFDHDFNPLAAHTRQRWMNIFDAYHRGESLPPVELIRIGECYFVRDGHHRISVARTLGCDFIDAVVTVTG